MQRPHRDILLWGRWLYMRVVVIITSILLASGLCKASMAQSTTGGRSGGSTSSTGTGYLTPGKRPAETNATSMTIADEGASRAYMYVPPVSGATAKNRSASPDGSNNSTTKQAGIESGSGKKLPKKTGIRQP